MTNKAKTLPSLLLHNPGSDMVWGMAKSSSLFSDDANYAALLNGLKQRIRSAQVKATLTVNQELIHWEISQQLAGRIP